MTTIFRAGALRVVIYSNDHRPPHVHVIGPGKAAKIALAADGGRPRLVSNNGLTRKQLARVLEEIDTKHERLLERWRRIHGDS